MPEPRTLVFLILVFAAVATLSQAIWGLIATNKVRRTVNRRLLTQERTSNVGELVLELRKQRGLGPNGERRGWLWLTDLIMLSGLAFDRRRWTLVVIACAAGGAIVVYLATRSVLWPIAAAPVTGLVLPVLYLKFKAARRSAALGYQLPNALEVVVRSLEAGHPVPTAVSLVGREMPDPIGTEFGMAADEISFGATLEQAIGRMAERCRHPDIDLFAATIRLQERAGGNLTGLLKMNARTIRERQKMRLKIKAASSEGRASAIILTSAPFAVVVLVSLAAPGYYAEVIGARPVQIGLGCLGGWMFLGNLVMRRMIDMRI